MKKRAAGMVSLVLLLAAYAVFRYALFGWHGMKEFPLLLLWPGLVVIGISGLWRGNRIAPAFTVAGYCAGFFGGYLFRTFSLDPGGGLLSNMWLIWAGVYAAAILAGILIELVRGRARRAG